MVAFEKMHGLGNDFILVRSSDLGPGDWAETFVHWCDRRLGIGADGVLLISDESTVGFTMRVYNADGSIPEVCGNGIRCAVRSWAARRRLAHGEVTVGTDAGVKHCELTADGQVSVDMGWAHLEGPPLAVTVAGTTLSGLPLSIGNPHLVLFAPAWSEISPTEAAQLEHHPAFPKRTNVSFAEEPRGREIRLVVWERGVGFTQACGSAACATAAAAVLSGRLSAGEPITVGLPGGKLTIDPTPHRQTPASDIQTLMTGPAELVFTGTLKA